MPLSSTFCNYTAVLAIDEGVAVQDLDYGKLRGRLLADGQILALEN